MPRDPSDKTGPDSSVAHPPAVKRSPRPRMAGKRAFGPRPPPRPGARTVELKPELEETDVEPQDSELAEEEVEELGREAEESAAVLAVPQVAPVALVPVEPRLSPLDGLQRYMRDVLRHPLLTREEEYALAVRYRETGDLDAAYRLVTANLRLVVKIAHDYHRKPLSLLDLVQEGNVGLMHAVKKFDPYRGVKLSSYSAWWIRAYILRYIMENWRIVKLGTNQAQRKLFFNLRKEQSKLAAQGFDPTPKLLAERLNVSEQDVSDMDQRLSQDEFSLDVPVGEDGGTSRLDRLAGQAVPADERLAEYQLQEILREKLAEFGKTLKDRERFIFEKRLTSDQPMTLQEIGDQYGLTRERARQIEAKLVRDLKDWIQQAVPDFKDLEVGRRD